ncbi:DUF3084 domain-containing protein [Truepera radiovictrix]|uniref:Uncharacterized protein with the myosin-like domain protein n=1 Tax=Truepera radiovictrix (strain DSM 17093 / CIP 108686 / LMG 22925 / RQ-24) TaxID=649638 RepID=D7CRW3_TRURR|nr:DUF3084 domain-containing protein [Truepera radiovictrix]ADI15291.1 Uncharacterized protein with the myosin-like domain protein [Truepera radiovictrix DSM 17093]WMT56158.1 DUF3084 domain-containing protein [Truepera radiovictrix]
MLYTLTLLLLLTVLAGVIAYAGDLLGAAVGRRRLSLFGWRPKRTGQAVGIAAGVLIMLLTLGVLSLAFRDAASVLLRAQSIGRELAELREQRSALAAEVARLEADLRSGQEELERAQEVISTAERQRDTAREARDAALRDAIRLRQESSELRAEVAELQARAAQLAAQQEQLEQQNALLQQDNAGLRLSNEGLSQQNELLSAQNREFEDTLNNLQNQVVTLQNELQALRVESEQRAQFLRDTVAQLEAASGGELTYRNGEIVYAGVISETDEVEILGALNRFVESARQEVTRRGASDIELRADQLDGLTRAIAASPGDDLVVLVASGNFVAPAPIAVYVEAYPNLQLLARGQLVATRQLHLGTPEAPLSRDALRAELARLSLESLNRLRRVGLFEQVRPSPSDADFDRFSAWLSRLSGPVVIGTVAKEPVFVAGPAELEFVILR